jgi:hypothetical protein
VPAGDLVTPDEILSGLATDSVTGLTALARTRLTQMQRRTCPRRLPGPHWAGRHALPYIHDQRSLGGASSQSRPAAVMRYLPSTGA